MFSVVLISTLLVQGIFANPLDANDDQVVSSSSGRTFNLEDSFWNPVNWFGQASSENKRNAVKLEALYNALDCVIKNGPKECDKPLSKAKRYFDKVSALNETTNSTAST